jgi:hypothetical protein
MILGREVPLLRNDDAVAAVAARLMVVPVTTVALTD